MLTLKKNVQVVEASQDFVPLILLTADRPAELQDAGANQAINQVYKNQLKLSSFISMEIVSFKNLSIYEV